MKFLKWPLSVILLTATLFAGSINVQTSCAPNDPNQGNSVTGQNVCVLAPGVWPTNYGSWVSYENTSLGAIVVPNISGNIDGPNAAAPNATFFINFYVPLDATITSANFVFGADDTATIWADGNLVISANPNELSTHCAGVVGCLDGTLGMFNLAGDFHDGLNTIVADVYQRNGWSYGWMADGTVTYTEPASAPEPGTFAMVIAGILLVVAGRWRTKTRAPAMLRS